jgi:hypothetical protein
MFFKEKDITITLKQLNVKFVRTAKFLKISA